MKNINILIIGAGELGSRHLQGILKCQEKLNVYCVDPSEKSLNLAKSRADEINHHHNLQFNLGTNTIQKDLFLVIVATSANVREQVVLDLLNSFKIENIILEKVLFQALESFESVNKQLRKLSEIKIWVNHPRRMFDFYVNLKAYLLHNNLIPNAVYISGSGWGLTCNALHFIDLLEFLTDSQLKNLDSNEIKDEILSSKRANFIEMTGRLTGNLSNNTSFTIEELRPDISTPISIVINANDATIFIREEGNNPFFTVLKKDNVHRVDSKFPYQSELSTNIVEELLKGNELKLPTFSHATITHKIFLGTLLKKYNQIENLENKILPIT